MHKQVALSPSLVHTTLLATLSALPNHSIALFAGAFLVSKAINLLEATSQSPTLKEVSVERSHPHAL
jgi:hypothetical protein